MAQRLWHTGANARLYFCICVFLYFCIYIFVYLRLHGRAQEYGTEELMQDGNRQMACKAMFQWGQCDFCRKSDWENVNLTRYDEAENDDDDDDDDDNDHRQ